MLNQNEFRANFLDFLIPLRLYGDIIKGKQTFLLMYTGVITFIVSSYNTFPILNFPILFLIISLFFSISGSTMYNMFIDRDIDAIMERTKHRAIPSGRIKGWVVLFHGHIFSLLGILIAFFFINEITGFVIFLGIFFDVVVYSMLLKRRTKYSIIFGGIAGGMPALAGRTAFLNAVDITGLLLAFFVISWIPVHILTLASTEKGFKDYKKANVPMWPVVASVTQSNRIVGIGCIFSAVTIFLVFIILNINLIISFIILLISISLFWLAFKNIFFPDDRRTFKLFKIASIYMIIAFILLLLGTITST